MLTPEEFANVRERLSAAPHIATAYYTLCVRLGLGDVAECSCCHGASFVVPCVDCGAGAVVEA